MSLLDIRAVPNTYRGVRLEGLAFRHDDLSAQILNWASQLPRLQLRDQCDLCGISLLRLFDFKECRAIHPRKFLLLPGAGSHSMLKELLRIWLGSQSPVKAQACTIFLAFCLTGSSAMKWPLGIPV